MTDKPPVSAIIRTKNEERLIAEVVQAALLVAREVIVVDSGSTDRTISLARDAGAEVIEQAWLGWGRQKRFAEDACAHDWILDLDADEVVTQAFADELAGLFRYGEPPCKIYRTMLALAPPVGEPWMNFGNQTRHKVYDRRVVRQPDHDGWDQFRLPEGVEIGVMRARLLHYAYQDAAHLMDKLNRNSSIPVPLKSKSYLALRITCGLPFYFTKRYLAHQYFRGGVYGFALALMYGYARWLRDVKMWERHAVPEIRHEKL
ncbi:glycosyltransferase family 2 protein [Hyphococcus sp.]|uniref:glycosyltransferase family 2 protein n=1 Tax=Hyphococcus sp. TaxID=2038636 RepID=UPI003CCBB7A5